LQDAATLAPDRALKISQRPPALVDITGVRVLLAGRKWKRQVYRNARMPKYCGLI
jgi:hypothetical protein